MAPVSLRQSLADLAFTLPRGFDPSAGLASLRPRPFTLSTLIGDLEKRAFFLTEADMSAANVSGHVKFLATTSGNWAISGNLHTSSTFIGELFELGFAFNHRVEPVPVFTHQGNLGGLLETNPRHLGFTVGDDSNKWIQQHWRTAFNRGGRFTLVVKDDPAKTRDAILGSLLLVGVVTGLVAGKPKPTVDPDNPPKPQE